MGKRICAIFLSFLVFFWATPSFTLASVISGTASRHSTTLHLLIPDGGERYIARNLDMTDWTIVTSTRGMTLAQAFGVDKGTVSFPKLKPKIGPAAVEANRYENLPAGDANPPSAKALHENYLLAQKMAAAQPYNWTGAQFTALNNLWTRESGWNQTAKNPSSGAYGIPQALPGSKMASSGQDWETDPKTQIAWGLSYIQSTYGTPQAAWAHEVAYGWY